MPISINNFEQQSVTIERPTITKDAAGGAVPAYTTVTAGVLCNIQPVKTARRKTFGSSQIFISHYAYFDTNPAVKRNYRLKNEANNTYYVVHGFEDVAGRGELFVVELVEQTSASNSA